METLIRYEVVGTTDDHEGCDCCGRRLHRVRWVHLREIDTGDELTFGTSCAARALGWTTTTVTNAAHDADTRARRAAEVADERRTRYTRALEDFRNGAGAVNTADTPALASARKTYWQAGASEVLGPFSAWMHRVATTGELR